MLNIKIFRFNPFGENTILLWDDTLEGVIVDPGCYDNEEYEAMDRVIRNEGVSPKMVLLTHGHFDHVFGAARTAAGYGIPVYMDPKEAEVLDRNDDATRGFGFTPVDRNFETIDIKEGDVLHFGQTDLTVISTPGHTPGGVCFHDEKDKVLLSGDTLFAGSIGRTDLPGGDYDKLIVSIMDKIMGLDGDTDVLPGHGRPTNIGYERTHNPFLQPFNEPEEDFDPDAPGIEIRGEEL